MNCITTVRIGPSAFGWLNDGQLQSTVGHELQHANDFSEGLLGPASLLEVRGFQWELQNMSLTGLNRIFASPSRQWVEAAYVNSLNAYLRDVVAGVQPVQVAPCLAGRSSH